MAEAAHEAVPEPEPLEPEPEPEPEPDDDDEQAEAEEAETPTIPEPDGPSPEEMEARFVKAEKEWHRYTGRITGIFAEQATELVECPLCVGMVPGFVFTTAAGRLPDETKVAVQTFLGVVQEADYITDDRFATCRRCNGLGKVATGSRVPDYKILTCSECNGRGYLAPSLLGLPTNGSDSPTLVLTPAPPTEGVEADTDAWGSPRLLPDGMENPNYGRMPQYKKAGYP